MLIGGENFREQLEINLAKSDVFICYSAFFTEAAAKWLASNRTVSPRDRLLIRALPADFQAGACSVQAIRLSIKSGLQVKMSSALHAKIYAFDDCVFTGSANLTGKGLALTENHNTEIGIRSELVPEDHILMDNLWEQGVVINEITLNRMEAFLESIDASNTRYTDLPYSWPTHVLVENRDLYCSDFPQDYPSNDVRWSSEETLKQTAAYLWIERVIIEHGEVRFGFLSAKLHTDVFDDPAPYRRQIKTLLSNLLQIIRDLDTKKLEVVRPNHTQLVRLRVPM